jgi:hypothetical protein
MVGRQDLHRNGGSMARGVGGFGGGIQTTGSSCGGDGGGGDVLEHWEANRGVRCGQKEKDEGNVVELTEGGEKRRRSNRPKWTRGRGDGGEAWCTLLLERVTGKGERRRRGGTLLKGVRWRWGTGRRRRHMATREPEGGGATAGWREAGRSPAAAGSGSAHMRGPTPNR